MTSSMPVNIGELLDIGYGLAYRQDLVQGYLLEMSPLDLWRDIFGIQMMPDAF